MTVILNMVNGEAPTERNSRGSRRRTPGVSSGYQSKKGSSVIVFTRASQPMRMQFNYPSLERRSITQDPKHYTSSESYEFDLDDCSIAVLDAVDDAVMTHLIKWAEQGDETGWRAAYIYRWQEEAHDYYTNNARIRRTKEMKNMTVREVDEGNPLNERNVLSA